jgi:hypothetical protein
MNCQPSFTTGAVPIVGPPLGGFGWAPDTLAHGPELEAVAPKTPGPQRRVPDCDIVEVGRGRTTASGGEPIDVRDLAFSDPAGSDVRPGARFAGGKYVKPLLALLILQITVVGGFYLKKRYAEAQVIVIPATDNERAVIT